MVLVDEVTYFILYSVVYEGLYYHLLLRSSRRARVSYGRRVD